MSRGSRPIVLAAGVALVPVLSGSSPADIFTVTSVGGDATPGSIQTAVDSFRSAVGNPNNGNAPGLSGGRREINWDGGGATTAAVSGATLDAFLNNRGARFTTPGTGFLQAPLNAPELLNINPNYGTTFNAFSPLRIFTPLGSNVTDVRFFVPGTNGATPATVSGFGAVFTDVALANATRLEFFDLSGYPGRVFRAPKGRKRVAWGVSPRIEGPTYQHSLPSPEGAALFGAAGPGRCRPFGAQGSSFGHANSWG